MTSPVREFQSAVYQILTADTNVMAIAKGVHDRVPKKAEFPYITFGAITGTNESSECYKVQQHVMQLHVWSRDVGRGQIYDLSDLVKRALHQAEPVITDNAISELTVGAVRFVDDPDGLTEHAVIQVSCMIEEN